MFLDDSTRVILKMLPGMGTHDYINASYINGYDRPKAYIASQGPKFYTIKDFWRLIWQERVENIVMATNLIEDKRRMCAEYWPQELNTMFECGEMTIKLINEDSYEFHDIRSFEIYYMQYSRRVRHIHLRWESHSEIPIYPNALVPVIKYLRQITETSLVPIVIHSGYTNTFVYSRINIAIKQKYCAIMEKDIILSLCNFCQRQYSTFTNMDTFVCCLLFVVV
jgi:protein tyrosine phosphatase